MANLTIQPFCSTSVKELSISGSSLTPEDRSELIKKITSLASSIQREVFKKLPSNQKNVELEFDVSENKTAIYHNDRLILEIAHGSSALGKKSQEIAQSVQSILQKAKADSDDEDDFEDAVESLEDPKPLGIANPTKTTCYAASAAQLFRHIPSLRDITEKLPPEAKDPILNASEGESLLKAANTLLDQKNHFKTGTQHDASEFYSALISSIDHSPALTPVQTSTRFFSSEIGEEKNSVKTEKQFSIQLPLENQRGKALTEFAEAVDLSLNEQSPDLTSTHRFTGSPKQLFLKLQRKMTKGSLSKKLSQKIKNVPYILDWSKHKALMDGVESKPMELKGVIVHQGSHESGHYVSYFQTENEKWYYASDSTIEETTLDSVLEAAKEASDLYYDTTLSAVAKDKLVEKKPSRTKTVFTLM